MLAAKNHVNIFIYGPIAPDPSGIINQGRENETARSIQVTKDNFPNEEAFIQLIKAVVSNNEKGGWRKKIRLSDSLNTSAIFLSLWFSTFSIEDV